MSGASQFGLLVLVIGLAGTAAVLSNRLSARLRVPAPAFFLACATIAAQLWPNGTVLSTTVVQHVVTVALAIILFEGGMHIGWRRFRTAASAIVWVGVAGTLVTAAGTAVAARYVAGMRWHLALLVGTAVAATDPAVVFSVFGRREIAGRTGVLLEGESGANDPVGIALLASLLGAQGSAASMAGHVAGEFALQMIVGAAVGVAGAVGLLAFMRRVPLPSEGLYAPRVLAGVLVIFGAASVARGSGFLAVFVTGILIGDENAPYKREIERFHSSLASLAEIVAFVMLGLTMRLADLASPSVWWEGLALAALLAFVIRPVLGGLVLLPVKLSLRERVFFLWTGLKGAVPILLGMAIAASGTAGAGSAYQVIFVVVGFSVTLQGGLVPTLAKRLRIPLRTVEPEPWSLGVRFSREQEGLHRYRVTAGSTAEGSQIDELPCGENAWVSLVIRKGDLVTVAGDTTLQAGDEVIVLAEPGNEQALERVFTVPRSVKAEAQEAREAATPEDCAPDAMTQPSDGHRGVRGVIPPEDNSAGEGT